MSNTHSNRKPSNAARNNLSRFESLESRQMFSGGSLNASFGTAGTTSLAHFPGFYGQATAVQSNNQTVIAGTDNGKLAVTRLNADGSFDTTFAAKGLLLTS